MRHVLCCLFVGSLAIAPLCVSAAEEPAVAPAPVAPAAPGANDMPLADAVESIIDEDEATRKKAFARLEAATDADIPVLEKFVQHEDAEVRRQVGLLLQKLKRGTAALVLKFPDGTPAAGQKVTVRLLELPKPVASDKKEEASGGTDGKEGQVVAANGMKIMVNGNAGANVQMVVNGQRVVGGAAAGMPKEVFSGELTADAQGKVVVGRYNDGDYQYGITTQEPVVAQNANGTIKLEEKTEPKTVEIRRGIAAKVTVVDEAGQPVTGAVVMNFAGYSRIAPKNQNVGRLLNYRRSLPNSETDEKGIAEMPRANGESVTLIAFKRGYEVAGGETTAVKDGETAVFTLKLVKVAPVEWQLAAQTGPDKPLAELRVLAVPTQEVSTILGPRWAQDATAADIPAYVEKGAVDLGTTDEKGELKAKIVPDQYTLVAFDKTGEKKYSTQVPPPAADKKQTATFLPTAQNERKPGQ